MGNIGGLWPFVKCNFVFVEIHHRRRIDSLSHNKSEAMCDAIRLVYSCRSKLRVCFLHSFEILNLSLAFGLNASDVTELLLELMLLLFRQDGNQILLSACGFRQFTFAISASFAADFTPFFFLLSDIRIFFIFTAWSEGFVNFESFFHLIVLTLHKHLKFGNLFVSDS